MAEQSDPEVVRLTGQLDMTAVEKVRTSLEPLLGFEHPIVDLSDVTYMDSAALSVFLEYQRLLSESGKILKIVTRSTALLHLFKITSLDRHIGVFPTVGAARSQT